MIMSRPSETELQGMTVNERLATLGLIDQWNDAEKSRDRDQIITVLRQYSMSKEQCEQTSYAIFRDPSKYGV